MQNEKDPVSFRAAQKTQRDRPDELALTELDQELGESFVDEESSR